MPTLLLTHPECHSHLTPTGHPERVARLEALDKVFATAPFDALLREDAPLATDEQILRAHPQSHIDRITAALPDISVGDASRRGESARALHSLDPDTHLSIGSMAAARRAAGANVRAVDQVIAGTAGNAFCAIRPPGHHAERETPMGFCLFGNVVIGARHALDAHGLTRVAIVDFDVHHGNGTQDLVWDDPRIFFVSTHQSPLYPGTGGAHETGAHGNVLNVPLPPETGSIAYRAAFEAQVLPALDATRPEMVFISAGFDGHRDDPLANMNLGVEDFAWITRQICAVAARHSGGRVVSTLEGGYDLEALAASAAAHVTTLMEYAP